MTAVTTAGRRTNGGNNRSSRVACSSSSIALHCTRCSNVEAVRRDRTMSRRLGGRSAFALHLYTTTISGPRALPKIANVIEDMRRGGAMAQMPVSPGLKDQHYKQHYE